MLIEDEPVRVEKGTPESEIPFPETVTAYILGKLGEAEIAITMGEWRIVSGVYDPEAEMHYMYLAVRESLKLPEGAVFANCNTSKWRSYKKNGRYGSRDSYVRRGYINCRRQRRDLRQAFSNRTRQRGLRSGHNRLRRVRPCSALKPEGFTIGSSENLSVLLASATAAWQIQGGKLGIAYNNGFIEVTGALAKPDISWPVINVPYQANQPSSDIDLSSYGPAHKSPAGLTAVYGQTLSDIAIEKAGNEAGTPGTFAWTNPSASVGSAGQQAKSAVFTPEDDISYNSLTENVTITVSKAEPSVTWPTPGRLTAVYGQTLNDIAFTGLDNPGGTPDTFVWTAGGDEVGPAGDQSHNLTFKPEDALNITEATSDVTVTVSKTNPVVSWPSGLTATFGQALSDISLTGISNGGGQAGAFAWANPDEPVGNAGENQHVIIFNPTDSSNYNTDEGSFAWDNPEDEASPAGKRQHSVTYTPNDGDNYNTLRKPDSTTAEVEFKLGVDEE
ncbi:MAG: hypothetical protein LBS19_13345 [Clostridiales bacterium]|nr:hypothetical protein [Clostridiales bacterium]